MTPHTFSLTALLNNYVPEASTETVRRLTQSFSVQTYSKDDPLLHQGAIWQNVWLIENGIIRMSFLRNDGQEFNKNFYGANALIAPLTPAMYSEPSLFGIHCVTPTRIWQCSYTQWVELMDSQSKHLWQNLQLILLQKLITGKLQREYDLLTLSGQQRYEVFVQRFPDIAHHIPLKHLASYLGITNVSLSRIRTKLGKART